MIKKVIKFITSVSLIMLCMVTATRVNAEEVAVSDVKWAWDAIKNNEDSIERRFKEYCEKNQTISEYLSRCRVSSSTLAAEYTTEALKMLEANLVKVEGKSVLTLENLLKSIGSGDNITKDIKNLILVDTIVNYYGDVFTTGENSSSELVTKEQFEKLLGEMTDVSEDQKNKYRESFAQVYYVQQAWSQEGNQKLIEKLMKESEDAQLENGQKSKVLKDSYVYELIYTNNLSMSKAKKYSELGNKASIDTMGDYDASYTYFFALANLSSSQVKEYLGNYNKLWDLRNDAIGCWNELYSGNVSFSYASWYDDDDHTITADTKWFLPLELDGDGIDFIESITTNEVIEVKGEGNTGTNITDITNSNIIESVISGRINLASILNARGGYSDSEYSLSSDGMLQKTYSNGVTNSLASVSGIMEDIKKYQQNTMYRFRNGTGSESLYYYFCKSEASKEYLFELPKLITKSGKLEVENSALGWFEIFRIHKTEDDWGLVAVPGEYIKKSKTFIYDPAAEDVYYILMKSDGTGARLVEEIEWDTLQNQDSLDVETVKVRQRTDITYITFYSQDDLDKRVGDMRSKMGGADLYYTLSADKSVDNATKNIETVIGHINANIDYEPTTHKVMNEKLTELLADDGIDYSSLKYCPDELDTRPICSDGWWKCAWKFLDAGSESDNQLATGEVDTAITSIKDLIFDVGNVIFILVTAFLGVKYIWGGVDSKFSVKNSLMTLVVAAIVFYGWDAVTNVLNVKELFTGNVASGGHMSMVSVIYNTIMYIINFAAIGGIIYIGIKYMMAGAEGKSELKLKGIPVVMGIIMVYGTINLINFILKIVEGL